MDWFLYNMGLCHETSYVCMYLVDIYLGPYQTSMIETLYGNSYRLHTVGLVFSFYLSKLNFQFKVRRY